jgi:hypothetical protein
MKNPYKTSEKADSITVENKKQKQIIILSDEF